MNPEDNEFIESLNCWEDNYDVITDNIQKLSGMLSLQIQLLQNVQEEKEHQKNVIHMTLEEQNISRLLNSFEQRFNVELSKLTEFNNKLDTLLTGQQALVTRVAQIEERLAKEVNINSPISVKSEEGKNVGVDINKHLYELANKIERRKVVDKPKTNYSLDIYLGLMDDKGNVISKQPLYEDKRFMTQECNETERLKRFGRKNSDGTVEWGAWQTY